MNDARNLFPDFLQAFFEIFLVLFRRATATVHIGNDFVAQAIKLVRIASLQDCRSLHKEGVPFYKVSDMNNYGNEHEMHSANNYVTEEQCRRNGWTPITEISVVFAKVGAAIMLNRKRLVRFSFLLDNNTMAYRFGSGWDINFGKTLFERVDLTELVQIGALPSYNATDVESVEISMPDKPEQYQIGEFFRQLDNLITLHQRQLEKLKNIKAALLEKMFV